MLPEYSWRGIEIEALAWAEELTTQLRKTDVQQWGGHLVSGSRQDDVKRIAFLEQHGFHIGGEFSCIRLYESAGFKIVNQYVEYVKTE